MSKAVYVKSYAHAEFLGMKPFDSLIGTVVVPGKKPKIVAHRASWAWSEKDEGKFTRGKMDEYIAYGERFYATTRPMLNILLKEEFHGNPHVVKVSYR